MPFDTTLVKPFRGGDEVFDQAADRAVNVGHLAVAAAFLMFTPYEAVNSLVSADFVFGSTNTFAERHGDRRVAGRHRIVRGVQARREVDPLARRSR